MKILLSTLPSEGQFTSWLTPSSLQPTEVKYLPLGLLSLASNISGNHEVEIIDPSSKNWSIVATANYINEREPDVLGFTAVSRKAYALYELLRITKAKYKVVGGPHCTNYSGHIINHGADAVFIGGLADTEFSQWLEKPVRNIIVRCNTQINDIMVPNRRLIDYEDYFYSGKVLFESQKRMSLFSSVGCPNSCTFCTVQDKKIQFKYPITVASEMLYLRDTLGAGSVHIMDDNFNINRSHVAGVIAALEDYKWKTEFSIRGQIKCDLSLVPALKKVGLKRIHVGIEALDDNILRWCKKSHRVEDIEKFCKVMNENEVEILAYFIIGMPGETEKYRDYLADKIRALGIKHPYVNVLFPEANTFYYDSLVKNFSYTTDLWAEYFKNPTPNYELPPPYGYLKRDSLLDKAESIIQEFKE